MKIFKATTGVLFLASFIWGQKTPACQPMVDGNVHTYKPEECQKAVHSKLFHFQALDTIDGMLSNENFGTGDLLLMSTGGACEADIVVAKEDGTLPTLLENSQAMACQSDLVVIGTVGHFRSQRNTDNTYIYTDYEIQVSEILKDNPKARRQVSFGSSITLARPGGQLRIGGRLVTANGTCFNKRKLASGEQAIFFLKYNGESDTYRVERDEWMLPNNAESLSTVRQALAMECKR